MLTNDRGFSQRNLRFLRQIFFEDSRLIFLECQMDESGGAAYCNDPSLPAYWSVSPRGVIDQIIFLNAKDKNRPIVLFIDSPGGLVSQYLNVYDVMQAVSSPIHTVAMGFIASAAVPVLAGGRSGKRFVFSNSRTMIHLPRGGAQGDDEDLDRQTKELKRTKDAYIKILSKHAGKELAVIEAAIKPKEHFMDAEETIAFGLADKIVASLDELFVL